MASGAAAQQIIGNLLVRLTGDAKKLYEESKKGKKGLEDVDKQTKKTDVSMAKIAKTISRSAMAIGTALVAATGRAIYMANEMGKLADKINLPVERLSALKFAAEQSGAEFDKLQSGLTQLGKTMEEATSKAFSPAAAAFREIGVEVTDSQGRLRDMSSVLDDVSNVFAGYRDSVDKTRLAVRLFGAEAGPALLPLLNQGKEGIKELEAEARRLGVVVSADTARAAKEFSKELNYLKARAEGAAMSIAEVLLPALRNLNAELRQRTATEWARYFSDALIRTAGTLGGLLKVSDPALRAMMEQEEQFKANAASIRGAEEALRGYAGAFGEFLADQGKRDAPTAITPLVDLTEATISAARDAARVGLEEILSSPTETAVAKLEALGEALRNGTLSWAEFGAMSKRVSMEQQQNLDDLLSATSSALTSIFQENKTAAIASALINTYQGITKALSAYPPPYAQAMAAIQAAQGFAQVANIRSMSKTGGGGSSSAPVGGTTTGAGSGGAGGAEAGGNVSRSLFVQGVNPTELYSGKVVRELAEALIQFQRDGGEVLLQ